MNFLMTATPLAMHFHGHSQADANLVMQCHVIAMYGPSFFTGHLFARFGAIRISALGLILTAIAAGISLHGVDVLHFWSMLIVLGIGWNFGFLGASALIYSAPIRREKPCAITE